jgi:transporter family-2 protein
MAAVITVLAVLVSSWDRFAMSDFSILAIGLAVFAGTWVGLQRALNGQINSYSKRSFATSQLNFITGTSFLLILLLIRSVFTDHSIMNFKTAPWWMCLGGSIGVIYIALSAHIVQHLGVLEFTLFSVGGMLIGSLLIDFVFPTKGTVISPYLIVGIALTYLGVIANGQSRLSRR